MGAHECLRFAPRIPRRADAIDRRTSPARAIGLIRHRSDPIDTGQRAHGPLKHDHGLFRGSTYVPCATAQGRSTPDSLVHMVAVDTMERLLTADTSTRVWSTRPRAGRKKRMDISEVRAIGSTLSSTPHTAHHIPRSAMVKMVGPEMMFPGRSAAPGTT